jgi:hypothetical protein
MTKERRFSGDRVSRVDVFQTVNPELHDGGFLGSQLRQHPCGRDAAYLGCGGAGAGSGASTIAPRDHTADVDKIEI